MPPSAAPVQLTEKLLINAGGWDAIRHARALRETGRVSSAHYAPPMLQGFVREGKRELRSGLKILSPSNVENICTCRPSREYGVICAHSLAVGLAVLTKDQISPPGTATASRLQPPPPGKTAPSSSPLTTKAAPALPYRADETAPARLHIVLAPDLSAAWTKNQILFGLEIALNGKRAMFGTPNANPAGTLLPEDHRVIEQFAALTNAVPTGMSFVNRAQFLGFLPALAAHPRLALGKTGRLVVESDPLLPPLRAALNPDGSLELAVKIPEGSRILTADSRTYLLRTGVAQSVLQPLAPGLPAAYHSLFDSPTTRLPAAQAAPFLTLEWPKLAPFFDLGAAPLPSPANASTASPAPLANVEPGQPRWTLSLEGSLHQLGGRLQALYPNRRIVTLGVTPERDTFTYPPPDSPPGTLHTRNAAAERAAIGRLISWGFHGPDTAGHYFLRGEDAVLKFFSLGLPDWQRDPAWQVTVGSRFQSISRQIEIIQPEVAVRGSGEDWFEMELSLTGSSGERFSATEIQRLLQMGGGHTRLRNGKLAILPAETLSDLQEVLRDCDPTQTQPGVYRLRQSQSAYLETSLERWSVATAPSWNQYVQKRAPLHRPADFQLPSSLTATLRPYQTEGIRWLHLLAANRLGGILADEMGLGKTLQALAYLSSQRSASAVSSALPTSDFRLPTSLVVCPTSLVDNWRREAAKFTPELKTLAIDGPDRAPLFAKINDSDLVITSYALLRRDLDKYRARHFAAVVLDEAHHIKNPDSQVARAACALRSDQRFVLTGTPMENSVRDLWSIMHFALPGYLGSRQDFRERYELPLGRPGDPTASAVRDRLTRRLRPVLLRRLKRDVAKDLPARIEQTAFCDLTPAQAEVYAQLLAQSRLKLDTARRDKNQGAGRMLVLTALLRLRQACCDLRLLGLTPEALPETSNQPDDIDETDDLPPASAPSSFILHPASFSAKLGLLNELLEEVRQGGHRVLIFSQFVSMLKLLSAHLEGQRTPFCYLDGSTKPKDRAAQVERFQTDESITAFLISVKAGGVGLNLTGADTVIHFDPWWNPAVEAQATDRAHRIGQTRVVTAYRLIARNTVEEKIFALQNRKKELTASLVEREKDEPLLETLSFEEIESLLE